MQNANAQRKKNKRKAKDFIKTTNVIIFFWFSEICWRLMRF